MMNEYRDILKKADSLERMQGLYTINAELAMWLGISLSYTETHIMCEAIRKIAWMAYESGIEDGRDIGDADYKAAYDEGYEAAAMDKLLHERLREYAEEYTDDPFNMLGDKLDCVGAGWECILLKIADEIERYYIPLPCDPEGKPWKIGDDCITSEGKEATIVGYRGKDRVFIDLRDECYCARCYVSDIKRPQPKVLDADGVEINVGDDGWYISYSLLVSNTQVKVLEVDQDNGRLLVRENDGSTYHMAIEKFSHKEPDSLEKLRDDMVAVISPTQCAHEEFIERISALVERGA